MHSSKMKMARKFLWVSALGFTLLLANGSAYAESSPSPNPVLEELTAYAKGEDTRVRKNGAYKTSTYDTGLSSPSSRTLSPATYHWTDKLKRGVADILFFPVEIAREIQITSNEESMLVGWTAGLGRGIGLGILRLGAGVVELVTFPFNFPKRGKAPLVEPEYFWQKPGVKYA
jgi:putative exosortase-associated protein (TIGR04073 family)